MRTIAIGIGILMIMGCSTDNRLAPVYSRNQRAVKNQVSTKPVRKSLRTAQRPSPTLKWQWPVEGRVILKYSGENHNKGIDIIGKLGTKIKSASEGVVVYAGSGLKEYGNLVIIQHDKDFLSAYAHNQILKVKEGERVRRGQVVALMGRAPAQNANLHFEIRYQGKSIDPLKFLPKS